MLHSLAPVVGIIAVALKRGETPGDDLCTLEVLLGDGTSASTWWETSCDWAEECRGRRVVAIQRASFRRDDDLLVIEAVCDDQRIAELRWSGSRMWSFLTRRPCASDHTSAAGISVQ